MQKSYFKTRAIKRYGNSAVIYIPAALIKGGVLQVNQKILFSYNGENISMIPLDQDIQKELVKRAQLALMHQEQERLRERAETIKKIFEKNRESEGI